MELLTVFWVDAAGTWTLRKVFSSKVRITHLSSHVANGCYGLRSPWAPRQHQRPKYYPIYTILYVGSHTPPLLLLHIKSTSAAVTWVITAQTETQDHSIYTYPVVSHASHDQVNQWMARAVRSCLRSLLPSSDAWRAGDGASTPRATRHILSHPTISQKTACGLNSALSQDFSSPSCISTLPFISWSLLQDTVPAKIPLPKLFAITWLE